MDIDRLEAVELGEHDAVDPRFAATDASNPVLLLIQQGPGLPMINEARRFELLLGLEQVFTVVYWDQRGCGRSLRDARGPDRHQPRTHGRRHVSLLALLRDPIRRTDLRRRVLVRGDGRGVRAASAARTSSRRWWPSDMDIDGAAAGTAAYDFALGTARTGAATGARSASWKPSGRPRT